MGFGSILTMSVSEEYQEYILERLACFGPVVARKMFGGLGLYLDSVFFALASKNVLYFKVDDINRPDYEDAGMDPFKPYDDKPYSMSYFEVPPDVLEDDNMLKEWAAKAFDAAVRAQATNSKKKRKRKK